jgi:D-lactate dehydrogenase (cytochrome)
VTDDRRPQTADYQAFLSDAAHYSGGHAAGIVFPRSVDDVVRALASAPAVLAVGAQSSLTGGATPMGEVILAMSTMARVRDVSPTSICVEPGVTVAAMQDALAAVGAWFPPAPTFTGATAGGIVATNAAGAATFKYGSARDWVTALTVVLADGTVLDLRRGACTAVDGVLRVHRTGRDDILVPVPGYAMPNVAKRSAGYFAAPGMDLIDLFIGSEGTLGVVTRVTFRAVAPAPHVALAWVPCRSEAQALSLVSRLRAASRETWSRRERDGLDVAAIEHLDHRSIAILKEDGADRRHHVVLADDLAVVLLIQIELPPGLTAEDAYGQVQDAAAGTNAPGGVAHLCRILGEAGALADTEVAWPGDTRRADDFVALREAVPSGVNQRVGARKRDVDARIEKTAADMIVPFTHLAEMMDIYRRGFESRGLDYAIWGHLSDGNVHPNVIPRSYDDVVKGKEAILEFGREVARLGGCPLAEHGVGRNPVKQALLSQLYGEAGIAQMRAVKRALDPEWKLAPGVVFDR